MRPSVLYYNCAHPVEILDSCLIHVSSIHRGVSMSEWRELGSHGPFKIAFSAAPWFAQFQRVEYGAAPKKNPMFADEREWYSALCVQFALSDVRQVSFMKNAPSPLGPRQLKTRLWALKLRYPKLFVGPVLVNDPYLRASERIET